jgi:pantetheine-phosphate adenylyltransferase
MAARRSAGPRTSAGEAAGKGARGRAARRALYAGSFDPLTNGHVDIIERGADLFDELVVAVGNNPAKQYLFDLETRQALVREVIQRDNVSVVAFSGLLVDAAREHGAGVLLRGLRGMGDLDLEHRNGLANRDLSGIETLFLLAEPAQVFVSSSLVKEIVSNGGDVARYVPEAVLGPLLAKYRPEPVEAGRPRQRR